MKEFINFFIAPVIISKEELKSRNFKIFIGVVLLIMLINVFYYI